MRLIDSSVEIIPQESGLLGVYKQIEIAGRTSYKSEDRITEDSAKGFVDMLIKRGHTAPLEHGTVYLYAPLTDIRLVENGNIFSRYFSNPYSWTEIVGTGIFITTNMRVIYQNGWESDLEYIDYHQPIHKKRITARFTCSRSISHELVRHRAFNITRGLF